MNLFEAVKESVTTRQAAQKYGIKVGRNGMACCPFHDDKHPSMKMDERFYCFGCGASGDVIDFVSRMEGVGAKEAALRLSQEYGIPYGEKVPQGRGLIKRRLETEEQRFRRMEKKCFRILSDYRHLLLKWKAQEAPKTPEEEWSEHFTEALMRLGVVEYQMDLLLSGDLAERAEFIAEQGKEVMALERRMAELAAGDKKEGGTRHGRAGAGHER